MLSPFFAWFFSSAKMRSCLRRRLAPSISLVLAISTSSVTGLDFRSDRCMEGVSYGRKAGRSPDKLKAAKPDAIREVGAGQDTTACDGAGDDVPPATMPGGARTSMGQEGSVFRCGCQ